MVVEVMKEIKSVEIKLVVMVVVVEEEEARVKVWSIAGGDDRRNEGL